MKMMMKTYWVNSESKKITAKVSTHNDIITSTKTAPIFKRFINQPLNNLVKWLKDGDIILIEDTINDKI